MTSLLRNVASPIVTFRFSLNTPGAVDGQQSYVNIATAESGRAENRPQLLVTIPEVARPTAPTTAAPATVAPTTAPPKTTPPTTAAPATTAPPTTAAPATTTPTTKPSSTASGWNLTFSDDFNGSSLDTSKWNYDASTFGDGNSEIECNRPGNVEVSDGIMRVVAKKGTNVCPNETRPSEFPNGRPWSSASINTGGKFSQAEGRFEIRAQDAEGSGVLAGLLADVAELPVRRQRSLRRARRLRDLRRRDERHGHVFVVVLLEQFQLFQRRPLDLHDDQQAQPDRGRAAGYHTYVMEWEGRSIRWYIDGTKVFEIGDNGSYKWGSAAPNAIAGAPTYPKPFTADNPMKLRINLAVGGSGAGAPDSATPSSDSFDVDYVRIYER